MRELTFSRYVKERLNGRAVFESESLINEQYPHTTIRVTTLGEYLVVIDEMQKYIESFDRQYYGNIFFRGMVDSKFDLMPSLSRVKELDEQVEYEMINEFMTSRPEAFEGLSTPFELLSKMQHYGLPTRMLDFTMNPLVALYFACEDENSETDGRVVGHYGHFSSYDTPLINAISGISINECIDTAYHIERYLPQEYTLARYLSRIYANGETIIAKPKYWNQRMINQASVFMIFPNEIYDHLGRNLYYFSKYHCKEDLVLGFRDQERGEALIRKIESIEHTSNLYADDDFVLTVERWRKIHDAYSEKECVDYDSVEYNDEFRKHFFKRFTIDTDLKPIDKTMLTDAFCSIIIDREYKQDILRELERINIDPM